MSDGHGGDGSGGCHMVGITSAPDGNLWTIDDGNDPYVLWRITPEGQFTRFPGPAHGVPVVPGNPRVEGAPSNAFFRGGVGLTVGPDGNLWFALQFLDMVGKFTVPQVTTECRGRAGREKDRRRACVR